MVEEKKPYLYIRSIRNYIYMYPTPITTNSYKAITSKAIVYNNSTTTTTTTKAKNETTTTTTTKSISESHHFLCNNTKDCIRMTPPLLSIINDMSVTDSNITSVSQQNNNNNNNNEDNDKPQQTLNKSNELDGTIHYSTMSMDEICQHIKRNDIAVTIINLCNFVTLGDVGIISLSFALKNNTTVKEINLQNTNITAVGVQKLVSSLRNSITTNLQRLYLQENRYITNKGCEVIASIYRPIIIESDGTGTNSSSSTVITDCGKKESLSLPYHALSQSVQVINLARCNIGDVGAASISDVLIHCPNKIALKKLHLYDNQISNLGASALAELILHCGNNEGTTTTKTTTTSDSTSPSTTKKDNVLLLQELFLWDNKLIGQSGKQDLQNAYLTHLKYDHYPIKLLLIESFPKKKYNDDDGKDSKNKKQKKKQNVGEDESEIDVLDVSFSADSMISMWETSNRSVSKVNRNMASCSSIGNDDDDDNNNEGTTSSFYETATNSSKNNKQRTLTRHRSFDTSLSDSLDRHTYHGRSDNIRPYHTTNNTNNNITKPPTLISAPTKSVQKTLPVTNKWDDTTKTYPSTTGTNKYDDPIKLKNGISKIYDRNNNELDRHTYHGRTTISSHGTIQSTNISIQSKNGIKNTTATTIIKANEISNNKDIPKKIDDTINSKESDKPQNITKNSAIIAMWEIQSSKSNPPMDDTSERSVSSSINGNGRQNRTNTINTVQQRWNIKTPITTTTSNVGKDVKQELDRHTYHFSPSSPQYNVPKMYPISSSYTSNNGRGDRTDDSSTSSSTSTTSINSTSDTKPPRLRTRSKSFDDSSSMIAMWEKLTTTSQRENKMMSSSSSPSSTTCSKQRTIINSVEKKQHEQPQEQPQPQLNTDNLSNSIQNRGISSQSFGKQPAQKGKGFSTSNLNKKVTNNVEVHDDLLGTLVTSKETNAQSTTGSSKKNHESTISSQNILQPNRRNCGISSSSTMMMMNKLPTSLYETGSKHKYVTNELDRHTYHGPLSKPQFATNQSFDKEIHETVNKNDPIDGIAKIVESRLEKPEISLNDDPALEASNGLTNMNIPCNKATPVDKDSGATICEREISAHLKEMTKEINEDHTSTSKKDDVSQLILASPILTNSPSDIKDFDGTSSSSTIIRSSSLETISVMTIKKDEQDESSDATKKTTKPDNLSSGLQGNEYLNKNTKVKKTWKPNDKNTKVPIEADASTETAYPSKNLEPSLKVQSKAAFEWQPPKTIPVIHRNENECNHKSHITSIEIDESVDSQDDGSMGSQNESQKNDNKVLEACSNSSSASNLERRKEIDIKIENRSKSKRTKSKKSTRLKTTASLDNEQIAGELSLPSHSQSSRKGDDEIINDMSSGSEKSTGNLNDSIGSNISSESGELNRSKASGRSLKRSKSNGVGIKLNNSKQSRQSVDELHSSPIQNVETFLTSEQIDTKTISLENATGKGKNSPIGISRSQHSKKKRTGFEKKANLGRNLTKSKSDMHLLVHGEEKFKELKRSNSMRKERTILTAEHCKPLESTICKMRNKFKSKSVSDRSLLVKSSSVDVKASYIFRDDETHRIPYKPEIISHQIKKSTREDKHGIFGEESEKSNHVAVDANFVNGIAVGSNDDDAVAYRSPRTRKGAPNTTKRLVERWQNSQMSKRKSNNHFDENPNETPKRGEDTNDLGPPNLTTDASAAPSIRTLIDAWEVITHPAQGDESYPRETITPKIRYKNCQPSDSLSTMDVKSEKRNKSKNEKPYRSLEKQNLDSSKSIRNSSKYQGDSDIGDSLPTEGDSAPEDSILLERYHDHRRNSILQKGKSHPDRFASGEALSNQAESKREDPRSFNTETETSSNQPLLNVVLSSPSPYQAKTSSCQKQLLDFKDEGKMSIGDAYLREADDGHMKGTAERNNVNAEGYVLSTRPNPARTISCPDLQLDLDDSETFDFHNEHESDFFDTKNMVNDETYVAEVPVDDPLQYNPLGTLDNSSSSSSLETECIPLAEREEIRKPSRFERLRSKREKRRSKNDAFHNSSSTSLDIGREQSHSSFSLMESFNKSIEIIFTEDESEKHEEETKTKQRAEKLVRDKPDKSTSHVQKASHEAFANSTHTRSKFMRSSSCPDMKSTTVSDNALVLSHDPSQHDKQDKQQTKFLKSLNNALDKSNNRNQVASPSKRSSPRRVLKSNHPVFHQIKEKASELSLITENNMADTDNSIVTRLAFRIQVRKSKKGRPGFDPEGLTRPRLEPDGKSPTPSTPSLRRVAISKQLALTAPDLDDQADPIPPMDQKRKDLLTQLKMRRTREDPI